MSTLELEDVVHTISSAPTSWEVDPLIQEFHISEVQAVKSLLDFLYSKGLLSSEDVDRRRELTSIIGIKGVRHLSGNCAFIAPQAFERLRTIVDVNSDTHLDHIPPDVQSWDSALANELSHWSQGKGADVYLCFEEFGEGARPLQRSQKSRLCYIHAPVLLTSYIQRRRDENVKMINMIEWMRTSFSRDLLRRHIFGNVGGDSRDILRILLGGSGNTKVISWDSIDKDVMKKFGAALVNRFEVHDHFKMDGKFVFSKSDLVADSEPKGRHAMILVGVRETSRVVAPTTTSGRSFLLQNWWEKKQFVECSEEYLDGCGADAIFVRDCSRISTLLPRVDGVYAEAADIDHEEAYDPED